MDVLDYMDIDDYSDTDENDEAIDDFDNLAELVAFPRRAKIIRKRPDHFKVWRDDEFLNRFRLNKDTVNFLLRIIEPKIASQTSRYVCIKRFFLFSYLILYLFILYFLQFKIDLYNSYP